MINDTGRDNITVAELIDSILEEVAQLVDKYRERFRGSHNTTTDSEDLSATRVCYTDECGEPCRSYVESLRAERDAARKAAGVAGERLGMKRAEVAEVRAQRDQWREMYQAQVHLAHVSDMKVAAVEALVAEWERVQEQNRKALGELARGTTHLLLDTPGPADFRAALSEGDAKSAHINDTSAGRCTAALVVKGESFRCDLAAEHVGGAHSSRTAEAVWDGGEPR